MHPMHLLDCAREVERVYMETVASKEEREEYQAALRAREVDYLLEPLEGDVQALLQSLPEGVFDIETVNAMARLLRNAIEVRKHPLASDAQRARAQAVSDKLREVMTS